MSQTTNLQSNSKNVGDKPAPQNGAAPHRTTILHLAADLELGPVARELVDLAIQTHRSGWRPLIASEGGGLVLEAERSAVRHTRLPLKTKSLLTSWRNRMRLEKLIEKEGPALIHAHGYEVIPVATKLSARRNLPLLIDLTEPSPVTPRRRKMLAQAALRGASFRVPSHFMVKHLREDMKLDSKLLYRVAPGVDLQWHEASRVTPERINTLHRAWRLPEQATVVVMATPLATGFGHKALLEALTSLKGTDLYAVLIGEDKTASGLREALETLIAAQGLEGKIIMPETCTDWPAACWLASLIAAVNVNPRGQAPELLAAQAIGRPVIVTNCGANAEFVKKDETAWVIPTDDNDALVAALREALAMSPARRIDLAQKTRAFMEERFPMELWRDSIFGLYDTMLAHPTLTTAAAAAA